MYCNFIKPVFLRNVAYVYRTFTVMLRLYALDRTYVKIDTFLAHSKNELMQSRGVCRLSVCLCMCVSVNFFAAIATTTPKMARSLPNLHRMVSRWARIQVMLKVKVKVKGHVIGALLCRSRKSLLVAGK